MKLQQISEGLRSLRYWLVTLLCFPALVGGFVAGTIYQFILYIPAMAALGWESGREFLGYVSTPIITKSD